MPPTSGTFQTAKMKMITPTSYYNNGRGMWGIRYYGASQLMEHVVWIMQHRNWFSQREEEDILEETRRAVLLGPDGYQKVIAQLSELRSGRSSSRPSTPPLNSSYPNSLWL